MHDALRHRKVLRTHDILRACGKLKPVPLSGCPCFLQRWNDVTESHEYAGQLSDGSVLVVGKRENAWPFWTKHEARMWRAERPKFWNYEIVSWDGKTDADAEKRSLPPEDEDEPGSQAERTGDIGRGPELLGANLPRFAGREP